MRSLKTQKKSLCGGFKSNYDSIYDIMGWYAAQNTRNTAFTPEEINERIARITREDIISCAKTFKPDTVFSLSGERKRRTVMNKEIVKSERLGESYSVFITRQDLTCLCGKWRDSQLQKPYLPQSTAQFTTVSRPRTAKISSTCLRA